MQCFIHKPYSDSHQQQIIIFTSGLSLKEQTWEMIQHQHLLPFIWRDWIHQNVAVDIYGVSLRENRVFVLKEEFKTHFRDEIKITFEEFMTSCFYNNILPSVQCYFSITNKLLYLLIIFWIRFNIFSFHFNNFIMFFIITFKTIFIYSHFSFINFKTSN